MVSLIDQKIGDIVKAVQERGWDKDTWFIYTSDHGETFCSSRNPHTPDATKRREMSKSDGPRFAFQLNGFGPTLLTVSIWEGSSPRL